MFTQTPSFSVTNKKFNVIILASGLGSRLKQETVLVPKPLVDLDQEGTKAIDYLIQKFQYIADRIIVTTAYYAELLEYYLKGKYPNLNLIFSREPVGDLAGPGRSFILGLDYASSNLPTIAMFCDYIVEDYINVDYDAICVSCKPKTPYVVDQYPKGVAMIEEEIVVDLAPNPNLKKPRYGGFNGMAVFQNTLELKAIAYNQAVKHQGCPAYDFDIVREYIRKIKTIPNYVSKLYEFGTSEMLKASREASQ